MTDDQSNPSSDKFAKKSRKKAKNAEDKKPNDKFAKKIPKKITESHLRNVALYYLQRYASSSNNLKSFLKRRVNRAAKHHETDQAQAAEWINKLIVDYERTGLLNDEVFLNSKLTSLRRRGDSKRSITGKLQQKGLEPDMIANKLLEEEEGTEMQAALRHIERKRLGHYRLPSRVKDDTNYYEKDLATMARAGFSYEIARKALNRNDKDI